MRVVFVHGWSATNTDTYAGLPEALARNAGAELGLNVQHLYLAKYISFSDEVMLDDVARAMDAAVRKEIMPSLATCERFACITHSTGGPVVRTWISNFYGKELPSCPVSHLVMLAPANHGSALAQLGKGKLSRMKFFFEGTQPGTGVLNWLELGSNQSWALNATWLQYDLIGAGLYTFVLTGQSIDRQFYDNLNAYTGEVGSDGVVRAAAANMNYGLVRLAQQENGFRLIKQRRETRVPFAVLPGLSHSGSAMGIMRSVMPDAPHDCAIVETVLQCLGVQNSHDYHGCGELFETLTGQTQANERVKRTRELFIFEREFTTNRYFLIVFRVRDDRGNELADYDIVFTAGPQYDANHLPPKFCVDRQRNSLNPGKLTYYLDYDVMHEWFARPELEDKFGFQITARPTEGFAYYTLAQYTGNYSTLEPYFAPNQTVMIDVVLQRQVHQGVFRLTTNLHPEDFKDQPKGGLIE